MLLAPRATDPARSWAHPSLVQQSLGSATEGKSQTHPITAAGYEPTQAQAAPRASRGEPTGCAAKQGGTGEPHRMNTHEHWQPSCTVFPMGAP